MGIVYEAEQEAPVRRRVALKLIKWGMDTKEVLARFDSERQALALMNHPNIARVYDAGATAEGRPYFAMEYVQGIPITEYCDKHRLPIRDRLGLFMDVCEGVQHAHQKGIIHRDIKPSNILVSSQDDAPIPKIIDFGVAKATSQRLTEQTVFTEFGQVIGTPEYMSPEQAEMTNLDIDTRTDVYSLGVLLYELLTGPAALRCHRAASRRPRRDSAPAARGRAAEAEQPRDRALEGLDDLGDQPACGRARAGPGALGGPRLDHDEGDGEGSGAAVRNAARPCPRHRTPSQRRAGAGRAAERAVSRAEVVPPSPCARSRGQRRRRGTDCRCDRHVLGVAEGGSGRTTGRRRGGGIPAPDGDRRGGQRVSQQRSARGSRPLGRARPGQGRHDAASARRRRRADRPGVAKRRTVRFRTARRSGGSRHARDTPTESSAPMPRRSRTCVAPWSCGAARSARTIRTPRA